MRKNEIIQDEGMRNEERRHLSGGLSEGCDVTGQM